MGSLTYDGTLRVEFDDRLLLHLQTVMSVKLRRGESFLFTWTKPEVEGGGRTTVWLDRTIPMVFDYTSTEMPAVSKPWLEELSRGTFHTTGLLITPDPGLSGGTGKPVSTQGRRA